MVGPESHESSGSAGSLMAHGPAATQPADNPPRSSVAVLDAPVLLTRDVAVGFGAKTVLSGINLGFTPGTITALIGPTGCGKSTFLRSLNRMNDKVRGYWRTGSIEFDGEEIAGHGVDPLVLRRRVGMVFQRPNPFPMSISDNVVAGVNCSAWPGRWPSNRT